MTERQKNLQNCFEMSVQCNGGMSAFRTSDVVRQKCVFSWSIRWFLEAWQWLFKLFGRSIWIATAALVVFLTARCFCRGFFFSLEAPRCVKFERSHVLQSQICSGEIWFQLKPALSKKISFIALKIISVVSTVSRVARGVTWKCDFFFLMIIF